MQSYLNFLNEDTPYNPEPLDPTVIDAIYNIEQLISSSSSDTNEPQPAEQAASVGTAPSKINKRLLETENNTDESDDDEKPEEKNPSNKQAKTDISAAATRKACREKARREKLNERFNDLGKLIDPSGEPKNDKTTILADAIKFVQQMTVENHQLKQLNKFLEERVSQYERERGSQLYQHSLLLRNLSQFPQPSSGSVGGNLLPGQGLSGHLRDVPGDRPSSAYSLSLHPPAHPSLYLPVRLSNNPLHLSSSEAALVLRQHQTTLQHQVSLPSLASSINNGPNDSNSTNGNAFPNFLPHLTNVTNICSGMVAPPTHLSHFPLDPASSQNNLNSTASFLSGATPNLSSNVLPFENSPLSDLAKGPSPLDIATVRTASTGGFNSPLSGVHLQPGKTFMVDRFSDMSTVATIGRNAGLLGNGEPSDIFSNEPVSTVASSANGNVAGSTPGLLGGTIGLSGPMGGFSGGSMREGGLPAGEEGLFWNILPQHLLDSSQDSMLWPPAA
eukprot:CAMPEP_0175039252 /NCGR_PEP_ID=MMETSP0052_2-20121109/444_1 /TAXON_ID=51329 ORGANISM="Polytomella parva, Strain SAG 63-3" /NCGR_SAMPLE_ID=MMETSP0052_2 /ASSEMBLY_ACC=CAM_ASM_000194 /LENGTH=501 /DNA_ID=CAMNT_0016301011 /DNA_START=168 /DNA_END=1673 /DNA_ORIENTATION=-